MPQWLVLPSALAMLALAAVPGHAAEAWKPVDAADLALQACPFEPNADAEALFWDVQVEDVSDAQGLNTVLEHYLRIKLFNQRGVAKYGTVDIPYAAGTLIGEVRARTIRPDGTIVPLGSKAVFERVTLKAGSLKIKNKSFAMPGLVPGAIIEYRYREIRGDALSHYLRLYFQREIPVRSVTYSLKPLYIPEYVMRSRAFHGRVGAFTSAPGGFHSTTVSNLPSYRDEPYMPPDNQVRLWMLVYYSPEIEPSADEFWKDYAVETYRDWKSSMKVTGEIERAAREAVGDATAPMEKLRRLYDGCRARIRNTRDAASDMSEEQRDKLKANKQPADALKRGSGSGFDINMVFAALCSAAGFEVRVARLADRSDLFFDRTFADGYFLRTYNVAVKVGEGWRFFDPGSPWVGFGRLRWQEEGVTALVCDSKGPQWVETPMSEPQDSRTLGLGTFRLDDSGALEGDVRLEYTGHSASRRRDDWLDDPAEKREQVLRDQVIQSLGSAEVTAVEFENGTDHDKSFVCRYHVRVPGFALKTGKRMVLQPAYFQRGDKPLFPAAERVYPVSFAHPWSTVDSVRIEFPEGWKLEGGESPAPVVAEGVCRYQPSIGVSGDGRLLVWTRELDFGIGGSVWFAREHYSGVKRLFDTIATRDQHAVTLRPAAASE